MLYDRESHAGTRSADIQHTTANQTSCAIPATDTLFRRHRPTLRPVPPRRACRRGEAAAAHLSAAAFLETGCPASVRGSARKDQRYTGFPQWTRSCGLASDPSLPAEESMARPVPIHPAAFV